VVDDNPLPYPLATLEETLEGRESFGDLAWAATAQNGFAHQSTISQSAFEALLAGEPVADSAAADELLALDYLTAEGSWTEAAASARTLFDQKRAVRVAYSDREGQSTLLAAFDVEQAIVVTGAPVGAPSILGPEQFGLSYLPVETLVGAVLRWLAVSPAWAFAGTDYVFSEQQLEALLSGEASTLPEEAGPQLGLMAGKTWSRFSIALGELEPTQFVAIDEWGYFAVTPVDGGFRLGAMHTSVLYKLLIESVFEQLAS
jgi:hypothetical protein